MAPRGLIDVLRRGRRANAAENADLGRGCPIDSMKTRRHYSRRHRCLGRCTLYVLSTGAIVRLAEMQTRVGLALAVMMAMALGHVKQGRIEQMRSLVRPIPAADTG